MNPPLSLRHTHWRRHLGWVLVTVAVLSLAARDAATRRQLALQSSARYGVTVDAPAIDPRSPTGYRDGVRSLVLPGRSLDGYHWIAQTQAMVAAGDWRVRHTDLDNAPGGREVHWAQPFRWWLLALAGWDHAVNGSPWGIAIERGALLAGPVLFVLVVAGISLWLARRFSRFAAALFSVGAVACYPFYIDFAAGYPDHHALANTCALLSVLWLAAAGGQRPRTAAILAGISGGVGLWISAATEAPVLVGLALGGFAACWVGRGPGAASIWTGECALFRWWGLAGAATSIVAWLLEYFPHDLALRLEVNHPVYALSWLAAAEGLHRWARMLGRPQPITARANGRDAAIAAAMFAIAAVLPIAVILSTGERSFLVADPFLWRLHSELISEFQSLPRLVAGGDARWETLSYWAPLLLTLAAAGMLWFGRFAVRQRAAATLVIIPAAVAFAQAWAQVRWWSLGFALTVPVCAVLFRTLREAGAQHRRLTQACRLGAAMLMLPAFGLTVRQVAAGTELASDDVRALAERDLAHWLRQRAGADPVVVAAAPSLTTTLAFHGGLRGIGTLYWENVAGLKTIAALYGARSDEAAQRIVREHGITHIVVASWDGLEGALVRLNRKLPASAPLPADAFIVRLLATPIPPAWLRPVPFPLPDNPALAGQQVRVYEIVSDQTPERARVAAAAYHVATGETTAAHQLLSPLLVPNSTPDLSAVVLLGWIGLRERDGSAVRAALAVLNRGGSPKSQTLTVEDRIRATALLASDNQFDPARAQLASVLQELDVRALRRLDRDELAELIALVDAAGLSWPDGISREFAVGLLPPPARAAVVH